MLFLWTSVFDYLKKKKKLKFIAKIFPCFSVIEKNFEKQYYITLNIKNQTI